MTMTTRELHQTQSSKTYWTALLKTCQVEETKSCRRQLERIIERHSIIVKDEEAKIAVAITMLSRIFVLSSLALCVVNILAFVPSPSATLSRTRLLATGGKGFGSTPPPPKKKQQFNEESDRTIDNPNTNKGEMNEGQKALQELRRERAEQRDQELRKVQEVRSVDEYISQSPDAAVIPEKVAMRMGKRMLPFVGIPLFGGMGAFVVFWYLATYKNVEFEPSLVAFTTIGILALGLVVSNSGCNEKSVMK